VVVDGVALPVDVRADLLVEKGARRFVVEVKTGKLAPRLETAATRRQLLEYLVAFEVDGVLLFDAEASSLRTVVFPDAGGPRRMSSRAPLVLVALALLLAAAVICSR
jgi:hypothetical protein